MKRRELTALFIIIVVFFTGCSVGRNISTQKEIETLIKEDSSMDVLKDIASFVDTTKTSETEITYTKIEYFEPTESVVPPVAENATVSLQQEKPIKAINKPTQAIKSITQVNIRKKEEARGITAKTAQIDSVTTTQKTEEIKTSEKIEEKPTRDTYRWRYIFWTVLIIAVIVLVLFFYKKVNKIKNLFFIIIKKIRLLFGK